MKKELPILRVLHLYGLVLQNILFVFILGVFLVIFSKLPKNIAWALSLFGSLLINYIITFKSVFYLTFYSDRIIISYPTRLFFPKCKIVPYSWVTRIKYYQAIAPRGIIISYKKNGKSRKIEFVSWSNKIKYLLAELRKLGLNVDDNQF